MSLHGSKSTSQVIELVSCENLYGTFASPFATDKVVIRLLKRLNSEAFLINYDSSNGKWAVNIHLEASIELFSNANFSKIDVNKLKFREIGLGAEFIYALYLPSLRFNAALKNLKLYPVKIGRTKNLEERISALSFTGPGVLVPGVVLKTSYSRKFEREIHDYLIKNRAQIDIPGRKEWFRTNINEVEQLFHTLAKQGSI